MKLRGCRAPDSWSTLHGQNLPAGSGATPTVRSWSVMEAPHGRDLFGAPYGPDIPELAHLCTAVVIGGEGGTLTLLGPVYGQTSPTAHTRG